MKCSCSSFMFGIFFLRVGCLSQTLTTEKPAVQTSARPTTINRVIEVLPYAEKSSTIDIFSLKSRRSSGDIWDWDFWCQFQPKMGDCKQNITKYYYDAQLDQCLIFSYSGCKGNENQFDTKVDCERHCKGATFMPIKILDESTACTMQPSAGLCLGYTQMYYFDVNSHSCKLFVYGGCGGNKNRFESAEKCISECGSETHKVDERKTLRKKKSKNSDESDDDFWEPSTAPYFTLYDPIDDTQEKMEEDSST